MRRPRDLQSYVSFKDAAAFYLQMVNRMRKKMEECPEHRIKVSISESYWCNSCDRWESKATATVRRKGSPDAD